MPSRTLACSTLQSLRVTRPCLGLPVSEELTSLGSAAPCTPLNASVPACRMLHRLQVAYFCPQTAPWEVNHRLWVKQSPAGNVRACVQDAVQPEGDATLRRSRSLGQGQPPLEGRVAPPNSDRARMDSEPLFRRHTLNVGIRSLPSTPRQQALQATRPAPARSASWLPTCRKQAVPACTGLDRAPQMAGFIVSGHTHGGNHP